MARNRGRRIARGRFLTVKYAQHLSNCSAQTVCRLFIILPLLFGLLLGPMAGQAPRAVAATLPANGSVGEHAAVYNVQASAGLSRLVEQADLVIRGRVSQVESRWRVENRQIETVATIQVGYTLFGVQRGIIHVRSAGGFLADRGLGMVSLHAAAFVPQEEVLLFLAGGPMQRHDVAHGKMWQVVDGAAGKFVVRGGNAINRDGLTVMALDHLQRALTAVASQQEQAATARIIVQAALLTSAMNLSDHQPVAGANSFLSSAVAQESRQKWSTPHAGVTYTINLNSSQVNESLPGKRSSEFRKAIIAAAARWGNVGSADFTLRYGGPTDATTTGYNGKSEILFMHKGAKERAAAAEVWYTADNTIVEADIWINDDYVWDATGVPAAFAVDLESALVHELGHWLILGHLPAPHAIMYPRLAAGSIKRELQPEDIAGISAIYPR